MAELWQNLQIYWREIATAIAALDFVFLAFTIPWILKLKKEPTSAIAWCLLVILVPFFGLIFFLLFGYQFVDRPLARKRKHREKFGTRMPSAMQPDEPQKWGDPDRTWEGMARLAIRVESGPITVGNKVELYHEGQTAFPALIEAIRQAKHHIHLEFFIFQYDELGREILDLLAEKAKAGVEVRLLCDGIGTRALNWWRLRPLRKAGGKVKFFLKVSVVRWRFQVNLRNHRKAVIIDGRIAFTGGMNIGDEYRGRGRLGYWRDTWIQIQGLAVDSLQRMFAEDWDFAFGETLSADSYYQGQSQAGDCSIQITQSGPDQPVKSIREIYFAAIYKARKSLWITTPYFVVDQGMRDALCMAALNGVDVKLLLPDKPDHFTVFYASRYYIDDMLAAGVKVYQYANGFVHAKVWIADGEWASVGSANFDNRSLYLNFEANALIYTPSIVGQLADQFQRDLDVSIRLEKAAYARRPWGAKAIENICRLFSPIL